MSTPATGHPYLDRVLRPGGSVLAMAHRGGAFHPDLEGLENTVAAFEHAVALGYDYLETDVHLTRDGVLLAFHDSVLDRVTDRSGAIAELTLAQVREASVGGREHVPTLAELFERFPHARFNIDIKSAGAVAALADFVSEHEAWERVLVGSFSPRRLGAFRRLTGHRVPTSAHPWEVAAYRLLPSGRLARRLTRGRVAALQVPHRRRLPGLRAGSAAARRWSLRVATPGLVRRAHAGGAHVHVWTIDEPEEMHELLALGVDGLFTDRTDVLRDVLRERGQWEGTRDDA